MSNPGEATATLVDQVRASGVSHLVLLMRHSARTFGAASHDLDNPLTDEGRELATRLGAKLAKDFLLRGYASPSERCAETARLILEGHAGRGGKVTRSRPAEALGPFYILDQMKMFRAMQAAGGQRELLHLWYGGKLPADIMIPADIAARLVARFATMKLEDPVSTPQLDVLVSHDMTLYTLRDRLLHQPAGAYGEIGVLDGMVFFRKDGQHYLQSATGSATPIDVQL